MTLTVCGVFHVPLVPPVKVSVFWLPAVSGSVSTVSPLPLMVTVTVPVGCEDSFAV